MKKTIVAAALALVSLAAAAGQCMFNPNPPPRGHVWVCMCDQMGNCHNVAVRVR